MTLDNSPSLRWALPFLLKNINTTEYPDLEKFNEVQFLFKNQFLLTDRSNTIEMPFKFDKFDKYKIPKYKKVNTSFEEALVESAISLANLNKKIYIFWSGGIDSTLVIVSFLLAKINKEQIIIICNNDSIFENYHFWLNFIKDQFKLISTDELMQTARFNLLDGIFVEANPADTTFGDVNINRILQNYQPTILFQTATRDLIIETTSKLYNCSERTSNIFFDMMDATTKSSPRPIENLFDFWWWFGYNFMWVSVNQLLVARMHPETDTRFFFNEESIQLWGINNIVPITSPNSYKKDYEKTVIYNYTKDQEYFEKKIKWTSIARKFLIPSAHLIDNKNNMFFKDANIMNYYNQHNFLKVQT
jgi:hypothetical protein